MCFILKGLTLFLYIIFSSLKEIPHKLFVFYAIFIVNSYFFPGSLTRKVSLSLILLNDFDIFTVVKNKRLIALRLITDIMLSKVEHVFVYVDRINFVSAR